MNFFNLWALRGVVQGKRPLHFLDLNGVVCSNTLLSNTSALTSSLLFRGNSTCKILEHLVWSNTFGFQFWGPLARTNFLSALCGLPINYFGINYGITVSDFHCLTDYRLAASEIPGSLAAVLKFRSTDFQLPLPTLIFSELIRMCMSITNTALIHFELDSDTRKEPKPKLFGPDIFGWGGGLPREGVGAKKFGMSLETQGNQTFWRDIPGFCRNIPGVPDKFEKKGLCSILVPYRLQNISYGTMAMNALEITGETGLVRPGSPELACEIWGLGRNPG